MIYLDPKNDLIKRIFGENPDIVKSFLNALIPMENGREIVKKKAEFVTLPFFISDCL
jgi:hypothetical protein